MWTRQQMSAMQIIGRQQIEQPNCKQSWEWRQNMHISPTHLKKQQHTHTNVNLGSQPDSVELSLSVNSKIKCYQGKMLENAVETEQHSRDFRANPTKRCAWWCELKITKMLNVPFHNAVLVECICELLMDKEDCWIASMLSPLC